MTLTKNQQGILGFFTLLPFVLLPVIIYKVFQFVAEMIALSEHGDPQPIDVFMGISGFVAPVIILGILSLVLLVFYIMHALGNKKIEGVEQIGWILLFIFLGIVAFPIYWLIRIRNSSENT